MHQVSFKTICPLKAFQLDSCPDNDAKSMVKHFIFLQTFAVLLGHRVCFSCRQTYDNDFIVVRGEGITQQ